MLPTRSSPTVARSHSISLTLFSAFSFLSSVLVLLVFLLAVSAAGRAVAVTLKASASQSLFVGRSAHIDI